jgi:hypothetical protein
MSDEPNDYLWDRSGPPDAEVERLEKLLGRYRYRAPESASVSGTAARPRPMRRLAVRALVAIAAGLALVAWIAWALHSNRGEGYRVTGVEGCDLVRAGDEISTGAKRGGRVEIGSVGHVELDPDSRLRVVECGRDLHKLYLEQGAVEAHIFTQPRLFQIGSPVGNTIDLGCAYRLQVAQDGRESTLRVTLGQVAFEFDGRELYVPAGAACVSKKDRGPGAPYFEESSKEFDAEGYRDALERVEFAEHPDPDLVKTVLDVDREHTLSVWHILTSRRAAPELRHAAYERLARSFPKPEWVTEEGLLAGDHRMCDTWLEEMKPAWRNGR